MDDAARKLLTDSINDWEVMLERFPSDQYTSSLARRLALGLHDFWTQLPVGVSAMICDFDRLTVCADGGIQRGDWRRC